ncbi:MAG TPA: YciI family protein [Gaiellaceae bacterium]|nr:YciI family protein [Gaiellaceae bacterium]
MEFDRYTFVLLRRGPRALEFDEDELDRLQAAHLAHLDAMRERGVLLAAGPFEDQDDETKRGICLYRTGLEETRRLAEEDPSVQAGRMAIEAMTWLTLKGELKA